MRRASLSGLAALFAFAASVARADDARVTFMHDGREREYTVHAAPRGDQPVPLVFVLHGGGGRAARMQAFTNRGFDRLADRDGGVVVYPQGIERHWNDGRKDTGWKAHREDVDDLGFLRAVAARITRQYKIAPGRVHACGISNGGLMSYRLAVEASDLVASVAPIAASMSERLAAAAPAGRPVSVMVINGTEDPLVPWDGGPITLFRRTYGTVLSTPATIDWWVRRDGCATSPVTTALPDVARTDGTRVKRQRYGSGREHTEVLLYTVHGGGHTWPGGIQYLPESMIGRTSRDLDATAVIWEFFATHARSPE